MNYYYIIGLTIVILALIALVTYFIVYIVTEDNNAYIDITLEVIDGKTLFTIDFEADYITVDYGDGTIQTYTNTIDSILHRYPGNGTYNVKFYNFKNLKKIDIDSSESGGEYTNEVKLTSIFFYKTIDSLELLNIYNGKLKSVDLTKLPNLTGLDVGKNELTSLDFSKTLKLQSLACGLNMLSKLEISNLVDLNYIDCSYNVIEKLDTSKLNNLGTLYCNNNPNLDLTLPEYKLNLTILDYSSTNNQNLDLTEYINLIEIKCNYNSISTFKFPNPVTKIEDLDISGNNITSYDFRPFTGLTSLHVNDMPSSFTLTLDNTNYSKITYLYINNSHQNSTAIENIINRFVANSINENGVMDFEGDTNDSYILTVPQETWKNDHFWDIRLNP